MAVNSAGSEFYVYSGTNLNALTALAANTFDGPQGRHVIFSAEAGANYQFRAEGGWTETLILKLTATNKPVFVIQPQNSSISPYGSAFFYSIAGGLPSSSYGHPGTIYQWSFNGVPMPGQNASSLVVHNMMTNQAGTYSVIASNSFGVSDSVSAQLIVTDTNPVPRLSALPPSHPMQLSFALTGEGGRWYEIESSSNLNNWVNPIWFQSTNGASLLSLPRLGANHFVRASLNVPTDICIAQLKQMCAAQFTFAVENRLPWSYPVTLDLVKPYMPAASINPNGQMAYCPEGGTYSAASTVTDNLACSIRSRGHFIPDP